MLLEHIEFLARVSVPAAQRLRKELLDRIRHLDEAPYLNPVFYSNAIESEYRKLIHKRYLILYTIDELSKMIHIEFVWDMRKDNAIG
jgi:plasmid stabilization system protein ParE